MKAQTYIVIFFSLIAFVGAASAAILTVTPDQVVVGEFVTIEGSGFGANETVTLSCSISDFVIPVSNGKYNHSLENFNLSDSNTSFSLCAWEVEDDVEVHIEKIGSPVVINKDSPSKYGFAFDYNVTTNTSTVAVPMPIDPLYTGVYELIEVSGTASGSATEVYMDVTVINNVTTDATGYFKTVIDTHGIPTGEYTITADEANATLNVIVPPTCNFKTGWNFISAPLNLTTWQLGEEAAVGDPLNVTPENSLASIYGYNTNSRSFAKCDHLDDWGWWPATGSEGFTELEPGCGYWVWAKNECNLTFTGTQPYDLDVTLKENWNPIGWYSLSEALLGNESVVGDPLNVTPENSLTSVYRYNSTSGSFDKCDHLDDWGWDPATGSEGFTALEPCRGYWVWAKDECVWWHKI